MSEERGWFMGCPKCGASLVVRNAAVVREGSTCVNCEGWETDVDFADASDSLVSHELGWCGCGNPSRVDELMVAYLAARAEDWPKPRPEGMSEDTEMLLSYIADDLDWTEHGVSVGGAWLTENGIEALANLRAASFLDSREAPQ